MDESGEGVHVRARLQECVRRTGIPRRWNQSRYGRDKAIGRVRGLLRGPVATRTGFNLRIGREVFLGVTPGATLDLGDSVILYDRVRLNLESSHAQLRIGDRSFLNFGTQVFCREHVTIGDDCAIGFNCLIMDNNMHELNGDRDPLPVVLEDRVWVGANVIILRGVTIGAGAVVAAGSVVTQDVPPKALEAGVPGSVKNDHIVWSH